MAITADIVFNRPDIPLISIIISTYGHIDLTIQCLRSISKNGTKYPIEIIVVDDAFPDIDQMAHLGNIDGLIFIRNESNLGFVRSCNKAAIISRGKFLYMLNNDTIVLSGAIDSLVDRLMSSSEIGIVGSKLLFPDGRLQEAGGIIWSDASGWNYGRGDDPNLPQYNYFRDVDYCSGASLMLSRDLFFDLGGFDEYFVPAYYEDTDLAFQARQKGFRVVYEPQSTVVHIEGGSNGTDIGTGIKSHQSLNKMRFRERWKEILDRDHFDSSAAELVRARDGAGIRKTILVIDHYVPEPDRDAGSRSLLCIMTSLVDSNFIVKFWPHDRAHKPKYVAPLEMIGIEVLDGRLPKDLNDWMRLHGSYLDHVLVCRPEIAADVLPQILRHTIATLTYYGHDIHFQRMRLQSEQLNSIEIFEQSKKMEYLERHIWRCFDLVLYPSHEESLLVNDLERSVSSQSIVPFYFDLKAPPPIFNGGHKILFVAGFAHPPNVDAAKFLVHEIIPLIEEKVGNVQVTLAGSNPTDDVLALQSSSVSVTGYVSDEILYNLYASHRVAVIPLRFGAGVKGKVVEALNFGLPLVTTTIGAQGIGGLSSILSVSDSGDLIADAVARLLIDDELWISQSKMQLEFFRTHFSREIMRISVNSAIKNAENISLLKSLGQYC